MVAAALTLLAVAVPGSSAAQDHDDQSRFLETRFLTYEQAAAEGLPVPDNDPALPFCPEGEVDLGFRSAREEERAVDDDGPETCQYDVRDSTIRVNVKHGVTLYR